MVGQDSQRVTGDEEKSGYGYEKRSLSSSLTPVEHQTEQQGPVQDSKSAASGLGCTATVTSVGADSSECYSVFTDWQKRAIIFSGSFIGLQSYMSETMYYPAINQISRDLHVSPSMINLTVTTFLIAQGLVPSMTANFSERAGRRPALILCMIISIAANLGLALQQSFSAMLPLRLLQAAGSSGTLSQGIVGDCITSAQRGEYIAYTSISTVLGPSLSPILGGVISQYLGWHWVFWFLAILSAVTLIPLALFFPETCRQVVYNGSIPPPRGLVVDQVKEKELRQRYRWIFPNPLPVFRILVNGEVVLLLIPFSLALACYYSVGTTISTTFHEEYGFSSAKISLINLAVGVGCIISSFTTGRLIDWNFRRHAKRLRFPLQRSRQVDLATFPIELVRLQIGLPLMVLGALTTIGYGWAANRRTSVAVPIVVLVLLGYSVLGSVQVVAVLISDMSPGRFALAAAARNICQCLLGAAMTAAIGPMIEALGHGWAFTTLGLILMISLVGLLACIRYGMKWRTRNAD